MSRTVHHGDRRIRVRGIRRNDPDLRKLARALIDLVQAEAEVEAEEQYRRRVDSAVDLDSRRVSKPADPEKDAA